MSGYYHLSTLPHLLACPMNIDLAVLNVPLNSECRMIQTVVGRHMTSIVLSYVSIFSYRADVVMA